MKRIILLLCCAACFAPAQAQDWIKIAQKDGGAVTSLTSNKYGDLYCAAMNQVYRSVDQGQSWQKRNTPIDSVLNIQLFASCDSNGINALFAFGAGKLHRSGDDGQSWTAMAAINDSLSQQRVNGFFTTRFGDFVMITRSTGNTVNVLRSRDNGNTFEFVATLDAPPSKLFQSVDSTYYLFNGSSLRVNKDHSVTNIGLQVVNTYTQDFFNAPINIWGVKNNAPFRSSTKGDAWKDMSLDLKESSGSLFRLVGGRDGVVYLFWQTPTDSMHIYRLNAGSSSWTRIRDLGYSFQEIVSNPNGNMVASSVLGIFSSEEGAGTWTNSSNGISTYPLAAAVLSQNATGVASTNGTLFQSNTGGQVWSTANTPSLSSQNTIYDLITTSKGHIACASASGLWISTDLGLNYISAQFNGQPLTAAAYCVQEVAPGVLYSSTARGLLRSNDDGMSWIVVDSTAIGTSIFSIGTGKFLLSRPNAVYAGDTSSSTLSMMMPTPSSGKLSGNAEGDIFLVAYEKNGSNYKVVLYRKKLTGNLETIIIPSSGTQNSLPVWVVVGKAASAYVNTDAGLFKIPGSETTPSKLNVGGEIFTFLRSTTGTSAIGCTLFGGVYQVDLTVGVADENESAQHLSIAPQPSTDFMRVSCDEDVQNVEVYSVSGSRVELPKLQNSAREFHLGTASLSTGVYLIRIHTASHRILSTRFSVVR